MPGPNFCLAGGSHCAAPMSTSPSTAPSFTNRTKAKDEAAMKGALAALVDVPFADVHAWKLVAAGVAPQQLHVLTHEVLVDSLSMSVGASLRLLAALQDKPVDFHDIHGSGGGGQGAAGGLSDF